MNHINIGNTNFALKGYPSYTKPEENDTLYRYMSFEEFSDILKERELRFKRHDKFNDPKEGTVPQHWAGESNINQANSQLNFGYVSCWRSGSEESLAMWDNYGKKSGDYICLKTNIGKLGQTLISAKNPTGASGFNIDSVSYIDFEDTNISKPSHIYVRRDAKYTFFLVKDNKYKTEQEVRVYFIDTMNASLERSHYNENIETHEINWEETNRKIDNISCHHNIAINPEMFIENIITSPYAKEEDISKIKKISESRNFLEKIKKSSIPSK